MSTCVSVMRPGNTMRSFLRVHFFRTITCRYVRGNVSFILLRIRHMCGQGNKWIVYTWAANSVKYFVKL